MSKHTRKIERRKDASAGLTKSNIEKAFLTIHAENKALKREIRRLQWLLIPWYGRIVIRVKRRWFRAKAWIRGRLRASRPAVER